MKQLFRFLFRPGTFFGQLQWSTHHWLILLAFLGMASVETHVGRQHLYYQVFADMVSARTGLSWEMSVWLVTFAKLVAFLAGAFALSSVLWVIGNLFGRRTSKRVLFRRMAIVFTVLLTAYTSHFFSPVYPIMEVLSWAFYVWGALLSFYAVKEQFALGSLEALVMSALAFLLISSAWQYSGRVMESAARARWQDLARGAHGTPPFSRVQ